MKVYNKLVRDNIPKIISDDGKKANTRILNTEEFRIALYEKLIEEATELKQASTKQDVVEELADIYEVIEELLIINKIDINDIETARIKKNFKRGTFEDRIFLESVED